MAKVGLEGSVVGIILVANALLAADEAVLVGVFKVFVEGILVKEGLAAKLAEGMAMERRVLRVFSLSVQGQPFRTEEGDFLREDLSVLKANQATHGKE